MVTFYKNGDLIYKELREYTHCATKQGRVIGKKIYVESGQSRPMIHFLAEVLDNSRRIIHINVNTCVTFSDL